MRKAKRRGRGVSDIANKIVSFLDSTGHDYFGYTKRRTQEKEERVMWTTPMLRKRQEMWCCDEAASQDKPKLSLINVVL